MIVNQFSLATYTISTPDIANAVANSTTFTYSGSAKTLVFTYNNVTLVNGIDYTVVSGSLSQTNAGSYTTTIQGIGNYTGTKTVSWKINKLSISNFNVTASTKNINKTDYTQITFTASNLSPWPSEAVRLTTSNYGGIMYNIKSTTPSKTSPVLVLNVEAVTNSCWVNLILNSNNYTSVKKLISFSVTS